MLTNASPSTNCGLPIHCRRSWNSACITPMIAGPPYAVRPILRKLATISRIELHLCTAPERASLFVDDDGGRDVLQRGTRAVEDRDLVVAGTARLAAGDDVGELRVHLLTRHQPGRQSVLQLPDLGALLEHVDDQG